LILALYKSTYLLLTYLVIVLLLLGFTLPYDISSLDNITIYLKKVGNAVSSKGGNFKVEKTMSVSP